MTDNHTTLGSSKSETAPNEDEGWCIVLNPVSGTGDHGEEVRSLAAERGYAVRETEEAGDAMALAEEAAEEGVSRVAACGGDGTVHEVVRGLDRADALDEVTFGVVPGGTGNNFAGNIGVRSVEHAFEVLETGERRRIDLGVADGEPFVNSCIAGLTSKTSSETSPELKERVGTLAYVITGIQQAATFDPLHVAIDIETGPEMDPKTWEGDALCLLVGNARHFPRGGQANVEDGLFDVTIVEEMPTPEMLTEAAAQRLFGRETEHVTQLTAERLEITHQQGESVEFSLDGEISAHRRLNLSVRPRELTVAVGPEYEPLPAMG
ncbi:diacylglycerol/lipid kinase family protein [Halopelagius longus]|uniref:Diacylglycerol kinase family lipid kinase n=1 Tax=Halopelagius longus TaxID=1236180 RepID=A0A1H1G8N8_9EURY|nr:diacylglycerol kinase family protein [Halopelagius longus]RDI69777.1 diacylglycerol kinase family lipid kinase [Halopelagius longus]SDR09513.1 lipid kinase, YegS/Rv2252/BmrU family [Halopelagius longus]